MLPCRRCTSSSSAASGGRPLACPAKAICRHLQPCWRPSTADTSSQGIPKALQMAVQMLCRMQQCCLLTARLSVALHTHGLCSPSIKRLQHSRMRSR